MIIPAYIAKKASKKTDTAYPAPQAKKEIKLERAAVKVGLGALGAITLFLVGRKIIKNIRKTRSERKFTTEAQQAQLLRSAMNPSGMSWLHWMDGTKEEAIYNIAYQITDFRKVQKEYTNMFDRSLVNDLQKELSVDEFQKFMNIINSGDYQDQSINDNTTPGNNYTPLNNDEIKGKAILIQKKTKIWKNPTWYPLGTGVKKVEPYYFINHLTTGNIKRINTGYGQFVEFVETRIKTVEGSVHTIYVNKADIKLVSKEDFNNYYKGKYTKIVFRDSDF
jgi:hypothetical protein